MTIVTTSQYVMGDKFGTKFPHHQSTKALWEGIWKLACSKQIYPFTDAHLPDFEPIFDQLIKNDVNDVMSDDWTLAFFPTMEGLMEKGDLAAAADRSDEAENYYLRAHSISKIARFPILHTEIRQKTWKLQKEAYAKGTSYWSSPPYTAMIPHKYRQGGEGREIPAMIRKPEKPPRTGAGYPVVIMLSGLDGYRFDMPPHILKFHVSQGWAYVACEIPGTGDCPAAKEDPASMDRVMSSVLDFIKDTEGFDEEEVVVYGLSTGGYYALRAAHTHHDRLKGAVAQGGWTHRALDKAWLKAVDDMEYAGCVSSSLAHKFGYETVDELIEHGQKKFSLIDTGIVNLPHTRIFLINGLEDSVFPIEDSFLMLQYGGIKDARFIEGAGHMGEPKASPFIMEWLRSVLPTK